MTFTGRVIPPRRGSGCIALLIGLTIAVTLVTWAISADQKIDDLRPKVTTCCLQMTKDWCIECTKFADPNDFEYYKQQYEASK
jgi:hypothetical protein